MWYIQREMQRFLRPFLLLSWWQVYQLSWWQTVFCHSTKRTKCWIDTNQPTYSSLEVLQKTSLWGNQESDIFGYSCIFSLYAHGNFINVQCVYQYVHLRLNALDFLIWISEQLCIHLYYVISYSGPSHFELSWHEMHAYWKAQPKLWWILKNVSVHAISQCIFAAGKCTWMPAKSEYRGTFIWKQETMDSSDWNLFATISIS